MASPARAKPRIRAPFSRYGGKHDLAMMIVEMIPPHTVWLEAFAGAAWVTLSKPRSTVETINDLDGEITHFYRVLRDPALYPQLRTALDLTPYARQEYRDCALSGTPMEDVERARRFFVRARMCRNGDPRGGGWSLVHHPPSRSIQRWLSSIAGLADVHARLQGVQIETADWRHVLKTHDDKECVVYADPPYVLSTRRGGARYAHEMQDSDHVELVETLRAWRGRVILSGFPSPLYTPLEQSGWLTVDLGGYCRSTASTLMPERIWLNYDPHTANGQGRLF